jgi:phosphoglycolate phosphatase
LCLRVPKPLSHIAVIFDLDGTLVDSAPDIHAACSRSLAAFGFAPLGLPLVQSFVGRGAPHLVARLLDASGADPRGPLHPRLLNHLTKDYLTAVTLTKPYPGVFAALDALQTAGADLAICTNKPSAPTRAVMAHLGLNHHFSTIIAGDTLDRKKPDPAPLHAAARALNRPRTLFVGDSEVDAETALNADLPFLLYTEGYRKSPIAQIAHRVSFADFAALPDLIHSLA